MSFSPGRRGFFNRLAAGAATVGAFTAGAWFLAAGSARRARAFLRPPGALPEAEFLSTCIRCGRCADACPNRCITGFTEESGKDLSESPGHAERTTPVIFPRRKACILCAGVPGDKLLCTDACPSGALRVTQKNPAEIQNTVRMGTAELDEKLCYSYNGASCGVCVRACPFEGQALRAGTWEKPILDPDFCIGCGLCERACIRYPQAIRVRPNAV